MVKRNGSVAPNRDEGGAAWYAWDPGQGSSPTYECASCEESVSTAEEFVCVYVPEERRREYLCLRCWHVIAAGFVSYSRLTMVPIHLPAPFR